MRRDPTVDRQGGFTLLETLVVMAISAMILAGVVAARPKAAAFRLGVEARAIMSGLRTRRTEALTGAVETAFRFDPQGRSFDQGGTAQTVPRDIAVAMLAGATDPRGGDGLIRFYPDGRSSGGAIALSLDGVTARIEVDWLTGEPWLR